MRMEVADDAVANGGAACAVEVRTGVDDDAVRLASPLIGKGGVVSCDHGRLVGWLRRRLQDADCLGGELTVEEQKVITLDGAERPAVGGSTSRPRGTDMAGLFAGARLHVLHQGGW